MAIQCLVRDVTQQKQREHRLALQLLVTQIVGENVSSEMAAMRVLEALCASQGWDVAVKWDINADENRLEFSTAWPGTRQRSRGNSSRKVWEQRACARWQLAAPGVVCGPTGLDL